jgi:hypothetical protein
MNAADCQQTCSLFAISRAALVTMYYMYLGSGLCLAGQPLGMQLLCNGLRVVAKRHLHSCSTPVECRSQYNAALLVGHADCVPKITLRTLQRSQLDTGTRHAIEMWDVRGQQSAAGNSSVHLLCLLQAPPSRQGSGNGSTVWSLSDGLDAVQLHVQSSSTTAAATIDAVLYWDTI